MSNDYSISELAKEFAVTTRTIRFYEDKGLLKPKRDGQKRIYSPADKTRLKLILRGKRIGLSLDESFEIIQLYHQNPDSSAQLHKLLKAIEEQKQTIKKKKSALHDMEKEIKEVENKCLTALKAMEKANKTTS
jgi:DNA-binding transcriptional MerR regulator